VTAPPRWATVWLPLALGGLVVVAVAAYFVAGDRQNRVTGSGSPAADDRPTVSSDLAGEWSGEGSLTQCAGFDDEGCTRTLLVRLTIDCSGKRCDVIPFDASYGSPPLRLREGAYRAAGPVPPEVAPTCDGVPTSTALWRLELTLQDGRLVGSYAESTLQSFDCGGTGVEWELVLEHR
jgi:hypothetical protein